MTRSRALPPRPRKVATCGWDGGCGWTLALPYPEVQAALIEHARGHYGVSWVAGQRKEGASGVTSGAQSATIETAPGRRANDGYSEGLAPSVVTGKSVQSW